MWFLINLEDFTVEHTGFNHKAIGTAQWYSSRNLIHLTDISQLKNSEYGQVIVVDPTIRQIKFGRDYLGHYPLLYACVDRYLLISDSIQLIVGWLRSHNYPLTFSEEALALYFSMGYVPQSMTLFCEIHTCENASLYQWENYRVKRKDIFKPIEIIPRFPLTEVALQVEQTIQNIASEYPSIDVWCSGGIDSSVMATSCRPYAAQTELLTLNYDQEAIIQHGEAELPFVREVAQYCQLNLRYATLDRSTFREVFQEVCGSFPFPCSEICTPPKYMLARHTRSVAVTGEGGDPLFAGVKNDFVYYMQQKFPSMSLGWIYALAHQRYVQNLDNFLIRGEELKSYVADYFNQVFDKYPGSLLRKLFYINTFLKQGSLIFLESYYASRTRSVDVHHPLTSLAMYQTAFSLPDHYKYCYPRGKIALMELYKNQLPEITIKRKKSGTHLPLTSYLYYWGDKNSLIQQLLVLKEIPYLQEKWIDDILASLENQKPFFIYLLLALSSWLSNLPQGEYR